MSSAWKLPILPVKPWTMTRVLRLSRIAISRPPSGCFFLLGGRAPGGDGLLGGLGQRVGDDHLLAGIGQDAASLLDLGAGEPHHQRHVDADLADGFDHAFGDPVAAVDAGEDVDQDGLDLSVAEHGTERFRHPLGRGTAADVEEVGRLAAGDLDHVHRRHGEACTVDDAADIAVQADIGEAAVAGKSLARVLLALVAQLGDFRPTEQRVLVERHFGVERDETAVAGHHQRIDLQHRGVVVAKDLVTAEDGFRGLADPVAFKAEAEGDLARLVGRLLGAVGEAAARHMHAVAGEQFLGLVFVNVHLVLPVILSASPAALLANQGWPARSIASLTTSTLRAMRSDAASIILPSSAAAPLPSASASFSTSRMRRARVTSFSGGENTSLAKAICEGWIAHLPSMPSAAARLAAAV